MRARSNLLALSILFLSQLLITAPAIALLLGGTLAKIVGAGQTGG